MIYCYNDSNIKKGDILFVLLNGSIVKGRVFDNTKVSNVGEYIKYNNNLYKCKTTTIITEDFYSTKFEVIEKGYMSRCSIEGVMAMSRLKINNNEILVGRNDYNIEKNDIYEIEQEDDVLNGISIFGED